MTNVLSFLLPCTCIYYKTIRLSKLIKAKWIKINWLLLGDSTILIIKTKFISITHNYNQNETDVIDTICFGILFGPTMTSEGHSSPVFVQSSQYSFQIVFLPYSSSEGHIH